MSVIGFCSAKHSPGATTAALAITTALNGNAVLIEGDMAGGDLAATLQLSTETGTLSALAAMRNEAAASIQDHVQLHGQRHLLIGPTDPAQMSTALRTIGPSVVRNAAAAFGTVVVDLGRLPLETPHPLMPMIDLVVVVMRPTLTSVDHLRSRLGSLPSSTELLVVGNAPYDPVEVSGVLNRNLNGVLPHSQRDAELLVTHSTGRAFQRSSFARAASEIADRLLSTTADAPMQTERLVS